MATLEAKIRRQQKHYQDHKSRSLLVILLLFPKRLYMDTIFIEQLLLATAAHSQRQAAS